MAFDHAEWKRRLAEVLKEHPDIVAKGLCLQIGRAFSISKVGYLQGEPE